MSGLRPPPFKCVVKRTPHCGAFGEMNLETVDLIIKSATSFYEELRTDENGRYRSWEHCYKRFHDARNNDSADYDYLSLHLAFYLASWGMYRGSSFLLQKDYKVHIPVIKELLKSKYDSLFGMECKLIREKDIQERLENINTFIRSYYDKIRKTVKETEVKNELSDTLTTKILMGTLGCVPAYDRYFIDGVKREKVTTGIYNKNSLLKLADFYEDNRKKLEETRKGLKVYNLSYPQMKLLDMGFWQIGFDSDDSKGLKIAH